MYIIERCNETSVTRFAPIYPKKMDNFEENRSADLFSTLLIEAMFGSKVWQVGNSGSFIEVTITLRYGREGLNELIAAARTFFDIVEAELPQMTGKYKTIYQHYLEDFKDNGMTLPRYGKII